jgi:hypothetical protein
VIDKAHATGLKVGQFVQFVGNDSDKPASGGPAYGYTAADQKKLASAFGFAL